MTDPTEATRRHLLETGYPQQVLQKTEQHWDTEQLQQEFVVTGFLAPYVLVRRKRDGVTGTMLFTHNPRVYFNFREVVTHGGFEP